MVGDPDLPGDDDLLLFDVTVDATVSASNFEAGGLVAEATVHDLDVGIATVAGSVTAGGSEAAGAIADLQAEAWADVRTTTVSADVAGDKTVGGLFGRAEATDTLFVFRTRLEGAVTANLDNVGGIAAVVRTTSSVDVRDVVFDGAQMDGQGDVGGVLGDVVAGTVRLDGVRTESQLVVRGTTTVSAGDHVAGLVGVVPEPSTSVVPELHMHDVRIDVDVEAWEEVGGLIGLAAVEAARNEITDVVVRGSVVGTVTDGAAQVGGLVGEADGTTVVDGATVHADVSSSHEDRVGGIAGMAHALDARDVRVTGTVAGGKDDVGGVLGETIPIGLSAVTLTDVRIEGDVSGHHDVGGVIGDAVVPVHLTRVHVDGDVTGDQNDVGGLIGMAGDDLAVRVALVVGNVRGDEDVGGLVGRFHEDDGNGGNDAAFEDVVVTGDVTAVGTANGDNNAGGLVAAAEEGHLRFTRALVAGTVAGDPEATGSLVGRIDEGAEAVTATDVVWNAGASPDLPAVKDGTMAGNARGVSEERARAYATYDAAGWSIANGRPRVEGPANATWTSCRDAFPLPTWVAPASCLPASAPVAALEVGGFDVAQLRNVPFDVTVSLVDGTGERAFAGTPSAIVLSATGGAIDGDLLRYAGDVAGAPEVTVGAGVAQVVIEDVFYTGLSGPEGRDVTLVATGIDGGVVGAVGSTTDLSVRDVEMRVDVSPTTVLVDGVDTATLTVDLLDADGRGVAGEPITLTTDLGGFVTAGGGRVVERVIRTDRDGRVQATLSPDGRAGVATVRVRCPGACPKTVEVTFTGEVDDLRVVPGNGEAWLYFAPLGAGVTTVAYELDGSGTWVAADPPRTRGPIRIGDLENGRSYDVRVRGRTASGELPATDPVTFTPNPVAQPDVTWRAGATGTTEGVDGRTRVTVPFTVTNEGTAPLPEVWVGAPRDGAWMLDDVRVDGADGAASVVVAEETARWRLRLVDAPLAPGATLNLTLVLTEPEVE